MVVELPEQFLSWNYHPRRENARQLLKGKHEHDMNKFFLEGTRHNPALCTAYQRDDGSIYVNAKIVGAGYVLKKRKLSAAVEAFKEHLEKGDTLFGEAGTDKGKIDEAAKQYQREAMLLFMEHLYLPKEKARAHVDLTKMSTIELARGKAWSSQHTWNIIQRNRNACLLFYRPPSISFEIHGWIDIHTEGPYYEFVNAVHDSFHYVPERRWLNRPVYIFNVEEVYDNSPALKAFGTKIA